MKSDGLPTYLLADIAYHLKKLARGYDELCDIWGADHHGYIPRMQAALKAFGHDPAFIRKANGFQLHHAGLTSPGEDC